MIYLKKVRKEKDRIHANYYPEDSKVCKEISISIENFDDFQGELVGGELETRSHLGHAKTTLIEMAKGERKIRDCTVMWY
ncbi:MAG: hypothetical protein GXZ11_05685 [Tissierellia bacterium]|nr:hypothetical protein [Tissierellia bacterium]